LLTDFAIKIKPSYNGKKYETNLTAMQEMYKSDKKQIFFKTKVNRKTVYAVKYVNLPSLYEFMRQTNCELYEVIFDGQLINLYFDFDIVDDVKREDLLTKILKIFKTIFENKKIYYLTNYRVKDDKIKSSFHIHIVILNRIHKSFCLLCLREHESDNGYLTINVLNRKVFYYCYRYNNQYF